MTQAATLSPHAVWYPGDSLDEWFDYILHDDPVEPDHDSIHPPLTTT